MAGSMEEPCTCECGSWGMVRGPSHVVVRGALRFASRRSFASTASHARQPPALLFFLSDCPVP